MYNYYINEMKICAKEFSGSKNIFSSICHLVNQPEMLNASDILLFLRHHLQVLGCRRLQETARIMSVKNIVNLHLFYNDH